VHEANIGRPAPEVEPETGHPSGRRYPPGGGEPHLPGRPMVSAWRLRPWTATASAAT